MSGNYESLEESAQRSVRFIKRYRWLWVIGIAIGCALGAYIHSLPQSYPVVFTTMTNSVDPTLIEDFLAKTNSAIGQGNYDMISSCSACKELNSPSVIQSISSQQLSKKAGDPVTYSSIEIALTISEKEGFEAAQSCILGLIASSSSIEKQAAASRDRLKRSLQEIHAEIEELNEIQKSYQSLINDDKSSLLGVYANGSYQEMLGLIQYRDQLDLQLTIDAPLEITTNAFRPIHPTVGPLKSFGIGLLVSAILFFMLGLALEFFRMSKKRG